MHKRLSQLRQITKSDVYAKEKFEGHFTTQDVVGVCRYGEYISDVVVYDFAQFFARDRKDLFVESPALVHTLVNVDTMEVNTANVAHFMVRTTESWWQRLQQGGTLCTPHVHPMYTPCTPQVHPTYTPHAYTPHYQVSNFCCLPVSVPYNEHWLLVVLFKKATCVCIKVVDSLHWQNVEDGTHTVLTSQLTKITQLMGFTDAIVNVTEEE